ncbi:MAG: TonB-dependent receptor [Pseudomonadales bacterium]|nr:TonB-dependent receptor [Pseudomonadales bacterium]MCP5184926.1 TonB-dependent receptor [Pseudomonadales bacterium]
MGTQPVAGRRRRFPLSVLSVSVAFALSANAAEDKQGAMLEEIVVTGTKREAGQQDTPIAISTITADAINRSFANDIRAVADLSPNVTLTNQTGFNALAGGIRGTGTISILTTQDPSVGIMIDEFALNHVQTQLVELYDIQQVEIYRGPQGTLFGKNSTGGMIAITTIRPDLEEFGADIRAGFGGYDGGAGTKKLQAAVDIPLIEGKLGLRFAGTYTQEDGYYTNDKDTATFPNSPIYTGIENLLPPELTGVPTKGAGERLGGKETFAGKVKLLWQPTENYEAYFIYEAVDDNSDSPPGINETPANEGFLLPLLGFPGIHEAGHGDPFSTGMSQQGNGINIRDGHRVNVNGFYLNQELSLDQYSIKSITGLRKQTETLPSTYTGEAFVSLFDATRNLEREQFQQELRLQSEFDGPFNFIVGGAYATDDLDFRAYSTVGLTGLFPTGGVDDRGFLNFYNLRNLTGDPGAGRVEQDRESLAFYFDGSIDFAERFRFTAGLRWTKDEKEFYKPTGGGGPCNQFTELFDARPADPNQPLDLATNCIDVGSGRVSRAGITGAEISQRDIPLPDSAYAFIVDTKKSWDELTWRGVLDFQIDDKQMTYFSVSTGFLAGGFAETCSQLITCRPYNPETNTNFEVGYKGDLLDNRLRLNAAVFFTQFKDLQRNQVFRFTDADGTPGQETITLNAGESESKGIEIETTWLLTDSLQLKANGSWLDAEYTKFDFFVNDTIGTLDLTSLDIPFAPEWQFGVELLYDLNLSTGASVTFGVSGHYQSEFEMSPLDENAANNGVVRQPTFTQFEDRVLVNANITYRDAQDRYYLTVYGKNLLNEEYRVSANSVGNLWNFTMYGAPLQWGLEMGLKM